MILNTKKNMIEKYPIHLFLPLGQAMLTIDNRCEDRKIVRQVSTPSFTKPQSPQKNKAFSQEMHLKIQLLSRCLKLSNSKPGCRV
jgi:hypothetical protein